MAHVKYPKTPHLPYSEGISRDDRVIVSLNVLMNSTVVVTEKMDGENVTLYRDGLHARSLDGRHHPSRSWLHAFHSMIAYQIPDNMRICGEYLYARHSIAYDSLPSYFLVFGLYEDGFCLPWGETEDFCRMIKYPFSYRKNGNLTEETRHLQMVPVLYRGQWDEKAIRDCYTGKSQYGGEQEGYVVRVEHGFVDVAFPTHVSKWVRKNHVQTDEHWMHQQIIPNKLK